MGENNEQNPGGPGRNGENPQQPSGSPGGGYYRWNDPNRQNWNGQPGGGWGQGPQPSRNPTPGDDTRAFSILSYIGILWLVGLLADRYNPVVIFHVNQGIILSVFEFALGIALSVVKGIIYAMFVQAFPGVFLLSGIGLFINGLLSFAGWCVVLAFSIVGIVHAAQGRQQPLPLIGTLFTVIR